MNLKNLCALVCLMVLIGCTDDETSVYRNIRWADSVITYSTQYDTVEWSAHQALDAPNTYPNYGDIETAWTSEFQNAQREFLELGYNVNPRPVRSIAIFETYNPGFVDTVYVKNPVSNLWEIVYQGTASPAGDTSRIFIINFPLTSFNVSAIRIAMNMPAVPGWNEIDAVGLSSDTIPPYTDTQFWEPILIYTEPTGGEKIKIRKPKTNSTIRIDGSN